MGKPDKNGQGKSWSDLTEPFVRISREIETEKDGKKDKVSIWLTLLGEVFFWTAKSDLDEDNDKPALNGIAKYYEPFLNSPDVNLTFYLFGYADYRGSDEYNKDLSEARAKQVRDYLQNKFKDANNCAYVMTAMGESKSYQPQANRGRDPNIINLMQYDRRVEICVDYLMEERWRVEVTGYEIWDQQLTEPVLVEKRILGPDKYVWKYVYDGIVLYHRCVVDFTVIRPRVGSPWVYKEGKFIEIMPRIQNDIKPQNDIIREKWGREPLSKILKKPPDDIVFEDPNWGAAMKCQSIQRKVLQPDAEDVKPGLHRLYTPRPSNIPSSVKKVKDLEFRNYFDGDPYQLTPGENPGDYEKVPHVQLDWPSQQMQPLLYMQFIDGSRTGVGGKGGTSMWSEWLKDQLIPLKAGSRQFEHISNHPIHDREHSVSPLMDVYYEQVVTKL